MPRKKAEPEVLQEETVQPEITQTEEQPALELQVEELVQPYGEEEPSVRSYWSCCILVFTGLRTEPGHTCPQVFTSALHLLRPDTALT